MWGHRSVTTSCLCLDHIIQQSGSSHPSQIPRSFSLGQSFRILESHSVIGSGFTGLKYYPRYTVIMVRPESSMPIAAGVPGEAGVKAGHSAATGFGLSSVSLVRRRREKPAGHLSARTEPGPAGVCVWGWL